MEMNTSRVPPQLLPNWRKTYFNLNSQILAINKTKLKNKNKTPMTRIKYRSQKIHLTNQVFKKLRILEEILDNIIKNRVKN